ncbi:unnamed protein product, partial [marine sediment metagenome]
MSIRKRIKCQVRNIVLETARDIEITEDKHRLAPFNIREWGHNPRLLAYRSYQRKIVQM